jgi:hypothetical protein
MFKWFRKREKTRQELLAQPETFMVGHIESQIQAQIQEHHLELQIEFYSFMCGVSDQNQDNTSRQEIIRDHVYVGMLLDLIFEYDNPVSDIAVGLVAPGFGQIGYVSD